MQEAIPARKKTVLVTGGLGYIGSHICVELYAQGYTAVIIDNLSNSVHACLERIHELTGQSDIPFYDADVRNKEVLRTIFSKFSIYAVIHLAGLKAVGESAEIPTAYYNNNLLSTLVLLDVMEQYGCANIVFSSSATVYGDPHTVPITEDFPLKATNAYGRTKLFCEEILRDQAGARAKAGDDFKCILLRYFNPIGAHKSGRIGENPRGAPNNLLPFVCQVAVGVREKVNVFGKDWPTPDGTGVRDYIHVVDLALGHIAALRKFESDVKEGATESVRVYNLGTGKGCSVLEMVEAMRKASDKPIPVQFGDRRPGDIATCYADATKAEKELGWRAVQSDIDTMCADAWRWQSNNPNGYAQQ